MEKIKKISLDIADSDLRQIEIWACKARLSKSAFIRNCVIAYISYLIEKEEQDEKK